ncbi:MAG: hypothetical protein RJB66_180 [Pseudomonadota bacterium]|jgi:AcrR family transcriptional regulator
MTQDQKLTLQARKEILQSALKLFSQKGYHAVSVRELAKASGQNISMISYYFGGKEGLYKTLLTEFLKEATLGASQILEVNAKTALTAKTFRSNMRSLISFMVDMKISNPEITRLLQREKLNEMSLAKEIQAKYTEPIAKEVVKMFEEAKQKKIIRSDFRPELFIGIAIEAIHGFLLAHECGLTPVRVDIKLPRDKNKLIDFISELFLEGIMK